MDIFAQIAAAPPTMDIHTPIGDSVIFTGIGGYSGENSRAKEALEVGMGYTLAAVDIGGWHTSIRLHGIEGTFNSVMFRNKPTADKGGE